MQSVDLSSLREPCSCGHEHKLEVREIFIGHDALKEVGPMLHDGILAEFKHPAILCDENTLAATKDQLGSVLDEVEVVVLNPDHLHATNQAVDLVQERMTQDVDVILAVGSGTIHDLSRYVAHSRNIDFVACPTAASVDGFVSTVAAMTWNGMKDTKPARAPIYVIADTTVISKAPKRLTAAGAADLFGKFTAVADWRICHEVTGEYICERICGMALDAIEEVRSCMDGLASGEEEPYAKLIWALLLSGLAMQMAGNSRPASGSEHHVSHFWEMGVLAPEPDAYHGEKVGIGLVLMARRYHEIAAAIRAGKCEVVGWDGLPMERLEATYGAVGLMDGMMKENTPDPLAVVDPAVLEAKLDTIADIIERDIPPIEELEALLRGCGCPMSAEDIGLPASIEEPTVELSPYVRARLTFNRISKMLRW